MELSAEDVKPAPLWDWAPQRTEYTEFNQVMSSPVVGDIDGDGVPEVLFTTFTQETDSHFRDVDDKSIYDSNGVLRVIDGRDGSPKFSVGSRELSPLGDISPLIVDIDGDGLSEIVYLHYSEQKIVSLNSDGSKRWIFELDKKLPRCRSGLSTLT